MTDPETIKAHLTEQEQGWLTRCESSVEDWPSDDDEFVSFTENVLHNLATARSLRSVAEAKLAAMWELCKTLPPLDWKPDDEWGDYAAYPLANGSLSGVDETNSGDVHSHGIAVGEKLAHQKLAHILRGD